MKKKQAPVSNVANLEKQAQSCLNSGKHKEAVALYKKLLQTAENNKWRQQLAYCYLQRALAFSARSMIKEALVLWENYRQQSQPPYEAYDLYITWLLLTNNQSQLQSSLSQLSAQQLDKEYPPLAVLLGFLMLTDHPEYQQCLPQESALIAHYQIAQSALQLFQTNHPDEANKTLKQLPYRSAFKDFRTLLKAAIALPSSLPQTQSLLAKIPAESLYYQSAELLLTCTLSGSALVQKMLPFTHTQRQIIAEIVGLNKKQVQFVELLGKQKQPLSNKIQFNLAIQFQSLCGSRLAQRFCHAMLTTYPAGRREFNKNFSVISRFEENRLQALACENNHENYDAEFYWRQCIKALTGEKSDNGLKIALILRHIADLRPMEERIPLLIESLEHDDSDRDSYLQILNDYSQQPQDSDHYKHWLDKTLKQFPQDISVLTQAITAAIRNKAYKKASQYAQKILKIDPVNTFAKQVLFSTHLAHAKRLLKEKKYLLVENEIQSADDLKMGKTYLLQTQLLRGFFCFAHEDKKQGLQKITESLQKLNPDSFNAHIQAAMEAQLTGQPVATILRALSSAKDYLLSEHALSRFIQLLKHYSRENDNQDRLHKAIAKVKTPLKKSLQQQNYDETLLLSLAQALDECQHFELLRHCSKLAQAKWQKPIWMYYQIYSVTNGDPDQCTHFQSYQLEMNLTEAKANGDQRAQVLIDRYLERCHKLHAPVGLNFLDDLFGSDDEEDPMDILFGHLPENIAIKLEHKMDSLFKKTSPERLVNELNHMLDNNTATISAIMQNPDLFTALMLVKAADELKIDIDVTVDDVLQHFDVGKKTASSFPF